MKSANPSKTSSSERWGAANNPVMTAADSNIP